MAVVGDGRLVGAVCGPGCGGGSVPEQLFSRIESNVSFKRSEVCILRWRVK
jgi:hypothetical protein